MDSNNDRPETGSMRFGDDWRGVFIRGDRAYGYVAHLRAALATVRRTSPDGELTAMLLDGLATLLESSRETGDAVTPLVNPMLRPFAECVRGQPLDAPDGEGFWWMLAEGAAPEAVRVQQMRLEDGSVYTLVTTTRGTFGPADVIGGDRARWLRITLPEVPR